MMNVNTLTDIQSQYMNTLERKYVELIIESDISEFWRKYSMIEKTIKHMRSELKEGIFGQYFSSLQRRIIKLGNLRTQVQMRVEEEMNAKSRQFYKI